MAALVAFVVLACVSSLATVPATAAAPAVPADGSGDTGARTASRGYRDFADVPSSCQSVAQQLPLRPCHLTSFGRHRPLVVAWGDSHAQQYLPAMRSAAEHDRVNLVVVLAGGCPPAVPPPTRAGGDHTECAKRQTLALRYIERAYARHPDAFKLLIGTFYAGYRLVYRRMHDPRHRYAYSAYEKQLARLQHRGTPPLFEELARVGMPVDVIGQDPTVPADAPACAAGTQPYQCRLPRSVAINHEAQNRRWITGLMSRLAGRPRLIDTTPAMCSATVCRPHARGADVWFDAEHLGLHFTRTLGAYFRPTFDDLVRR